jgi:hypothetical protein
MIGDIPIEVFDYEYYKNALYGFEMTFSTNFHSKMRDMLIGKYGKPTNETVDQVQTNAGVYHESVTSRWRFAEGSLVLRELSIDINTSSLVFENSVAEEQMRADEATKNQAQGASAF